MAPDRDAELTLLRARVRDRVTSSDTLMATVRSRSRLQNDRAHTLFARAGRQLDHNARGLPGALGLRTQLDDRLPLGDLDGVLEAACSLYPGARSAGLTAVVEIAGVGRRCYKTVRSFGAGEILDGAQYTLRDGPCIDAVELDQVAELRADDLDSEDGADHWSGFRRVARAFGIRSTVSIAVPWTGQLRLAPLGDPVLASINLYSFDAHTFAGPEARGLVLGAWAGSRMTGQGPSEVYAGRVGPTQN